MVAGRIVNMPQIPSTKPADVPDSLWDQPFEMQPVVGQSRGLSDRAMGHQFLSPGSPSAVQARHPQIAGPLTHVEDDPVPCYRDAQVADTDIGQRSPGLVRMKDGDGGTHRALPGIQALRPDATKAVALRKKVEDVAVRRPSRLVLPPAVRDGDPFRLRNRSRAAEWSYEDPRAPRHRGAERDPAIVRREARIPKSVRRMVQQRHPLLRSQVNYRDAGGGSSQHEQLLRIVRPVVVRAIFAYSFGTACRQRDGVSDRGLLLGLPIRQ